MALVDRQFAYELGASGAQLDMKTLANIQEVFGAIAVSDEDTKTTMRLFQQEHDFTLCPVCIIPHPYQFCPLRSSNVLLVVVIFCLMPLSQHSAIGVHAARTTFSSLITKDTPMVCILTAHPAKFEETVRQAIGRDPLFPPTITALRSKPHRYTWLRQQSISSVNTAAITTDTPTNTTMPTVKESNDDNNDKGKVIGWRQQWIDTIKQKIVEITNTHQHQQQRQQQQQQPSSLIRVHQTDFHPGTGNALQACVATLLGRSLDSVPNFITLSCGYDQGIEEFVAPHFHVCKIMLTDLKNRTNDINNQSSAVIPINQLVILRGKSPRGTQTNYPIYSVQYCFSPRVSFLSHPPCSNISPLLLPISPLHFYLPYQVPTDTL